MEPDEKDEISDPHDIFGSFKDLQRLKKQSNKKEGGGIIEFLGLILSFIKEGFIIKISNPDAEKKREGIWIDLKTGREKNDDADSSADRAKNLGLTVITLE
ncbi:MAG: hypothetical protein M1269_13785 [Chloroflexi bacterium]|nr:hypothetical protein [Chloroflexota bacterium]